MSQHLFKFRFEKSRLGPRRRTCLLRRAARLRRTASTGSWAVGGWTKTRPVSLGLLPSGPDPVGERYVLRQPPGAYVDQDAAPRKGRLAEVADQFEI